MSPAETTVLAALSAGDPDAEIRKEIFMMIRAIVQQELSIAMEAFINNNMPRAFEMHSYQIGKIALEALKYKFNSNQWNV